VDATKTGESRNRGQKDAQKNESITHPVTDVPVDQVLQAASLLRCVIRSYRRLLAELPSADGRPVHSNRKATIYSDEVR
jgi:hypothetical protein